MTVPSPRSAPLAVLLSLVFAAVLFRTAWLSDDALITLRSVLNVIHGYGLTFNVAERVQTFTHPLWLLMLTPVTLVVGNVYYAAFALAIGVSVLVFWLALRGAASAAQAWMVAGVLLLSRAFIDFSTSGLENPLSNLLLALFVGLALGPGRDGRPRLTALWTVGSLLYLSRPDDVLFAAPTLLVLTLRSGPWLRTARHVALGLIPALVWTGFAVIYYGFPFPNTAYAKLATGISRPELWHQGFIYLIDSLDRDPISLITIGFGIGLGLLSRGPIRGLAAGVALYLAYVVSIGGDFMAGRFIATPLFLSVILLSRMVMADAARAWAAAGILIAVGLSSPPTTLSSNSGFETTAGKTSGVIDERAHYFKTQSLVLANRRSFATPEWTSGQRLPVNMNVLDTCGLMGSAGLEWGPMTHLLDECALADPLLARLPAIFNPEWRTGHFRRMVPEDYRQSIELRANRLADPGLRALYDDILLITRSRRLLSAERLAAIWRANTGVSATGLDYRYYRYGGSIATLDELGAVVPDGTFGNAPNARDLTTPLAVFVEDRPGRRHLDVTLDSDDSYMLTFIRANRIVTTMTLGPIPQHRRQPGLASYTESLPPTATREGFDTIVIGPLAGENFAIGHLLLDGHAPTDAELSRRIMIRDRAIPR